MALAGTLLLAASLSFSAEPQPRPLSLLDVPFISQSEALCGGAAAAMVLRYWGHDAVSAEDFAFLVDSRAGGISTTDLASAVQARGPAALAASGTAWLARAELAAGRPVITLIEDRPGAFHYVVLVGWHERAVVVHDPARTPFVVMRPDEFERRWKASANWMLAVVPGAGTAPRPAMSGDTEPESEARRGAPAGSCDELVADGVGLAQRHDLTAAEPLLAEAAYRCPGAAPLRELAGLRLLQRRWPEVRDLAGQAAAMDPSDSHAWRLLATARYIGGDAAAALDAWNVAGEPEVDLVTASGLQRTRHRAIERVLGLESGDFLTRAGFDRARRRLAEVPATLATRLEYVARGGGRAEVRAHVAERTVVPRGRLTWMLLGLRAAASRELVVGVNSLAHEGERLEASWRFWPHRPGYGVSLALPVAFAGIVRLEGFAEEQPFTDATLATMERAGARLQLADWASGSLRWAVRGGMEQWSRERTFGVVGVATRFERRGAALTAAVDAWLGTPRFASGALGLSWSSSTSRHGAAYAIRGGFEAVSAETPLALWPAADTGHVRAPLLRAHPALDDGRLDVRRLGRWLAHAGGEAQHWWRGPGLLAVGAAAFVDTARTGRSYRGDPPAGIDAGLGLRLSVPGTPGMLRVDFARGLRDGQQALSVFWQP